MDETISQKTNVRWKVIPLVITVAFSLVTVQIMALSQSILISLGMGLLSLYAVRIEEFMNGEIRFSTNSIQRLVFIFILISFLSFAVATIGAIV